MSKQKIFGELANRVTTQEMNDVYSELKDLVGHQFSKFKLSNPLESKTSHGDIDIVVLKKQNVDNIQIIYNILFYCYSQLLDFKHNGPIYHVLFKSNYISKSVQVDFIFTTEDEFDSTLMYLQYGDFSGILGVIARKHNYNYTNHGIYKIYIDKNNQYHYIKISNSLIDGLKILGYLDIDKYNNIKSLDDTVDFLSMSDLFYSNSLLSNLNHGDRKRMRSNRESACEIRNKLLSLNKENKNIDSDFYLKSLFPVEYNNYLIKCKEIDNYVFPKEKYNGNFIIKNFPEIKPGPIFKEIFLFWKEKYGDNINNIDEVNLLSDTKEYISRK